MERIHGLYREARRGSVEAREKLEVLLREEYRKMYGEPPKNIEYRPPPDIPINKRFSPDIRSFANELLKEIRKRLKEVGISLKRLKDIGKIDKKTIRDIEHLIRALPPNGIITELEKLEHVRKDDVVAHLHARELTADCTSPTREHLSSHTLAYTFAPNAHVAVIHGKILRRKADKRRGGKERYVEERKPLFVIYYYIVKDTKTGKKLIYLDSIQPTIHVTYLGSRDKLGETYWKANWVVPHIVDTIEKLVHLHGAEAIIVPTITLSNDAVFQMDLHDEFKRRGAKPFKLDVSSLDLGGVPEKTLDSPHMLVEIYGKDLSSEKLFLLHKLKKS